MIVHMYFIQSGDDNMAKSIYMDNNATTATKPEVVEAMLPYYTEIWGNASSKFYQTGIDAINALDKMRTSIAERIGASKPNEIYFTASGCEADNWAIKGFAFANKDKGNHIITSSIEHHAILNACAYLEKHGFTVTYLPVDSEGRITPKQVEDAITEDTILISIMTANNEIGTIQPIKEIGMIAKKHNVLFHTDAVQAVGNVNIRVKELNIDLLSLSAHKFYGPKGVGALYVRNGVEFNKIQDGGHQEKDKRAGTENVPGIVGIGKAIEIANNNLEDYNKKLLSLREYFIEEVERKIPDSKLNGHRKSRLPGNVNFSFKGIEGQSLLFKLDERGICVSTGSACSSGNSNPSHVLKALGLPYEIAQGSIRVAFGESNTREDVDYLVENLVEIVGELRGNNKDK